LTERIRQSNGADFVVNKGSGSYLGGEITGGAVGAATASLIAARLTFGLSSRIALHAAHHSFPLLGGAKLAHIQITLWVIGMKGSGVNLRIPLPW